jgi:hypothetical protein
MNSTQGQNRIINSINGQRVFLLDYKRGDVTGDHIPDNVYLYGNKPDGAAGVYADNITLVIQNGRTNQSKAVTPAFNAGYNARLFLGDFDMDGVNDIKVTLDTGGSGGYIIAYIYSYKNLILRELFNFETYNNQFKYKAHYNDFYRFSIGSIRYDQLFVLDLSTKSGDYLSGLYDADGKLISPKQGEVLALGALFPIVTDEKNGHFDLFALQRITGVYNADTLGYAENLLSWDGQSFSLKNMSVAISGTTLTQTL